MCMWMSSRYTHNAVLDAEAQLVPEVWPADEHHGDRRTPNNVHLDPGLRLETLRREKRESSLRKPARLLQTN